MRLCSEPEQDQVVLVQQQHVAKRGWHLSSNRQLRLEMVTPQVEMEHEHPSAEIQLT
uniref:Uncharacterized protein n=1 Tax=Arundo donax TaxID=35708 RepID=A0A0A9ECB7_ARUDO